jgi:hypothetical protein
MEEAVPLERYVHPVLRFALDLPPGMEVHDTGPDVALVAREAEGATPSPFRANLTVVVERLHPGTSLEQYVDGSLREQTRTLALWVLIDEAETTIAGRRAVRTLGHHVFGEFGVALEQWRLVDGDHGWVIGASCDVLDYPVVADVATACAESFELP